MGKCTPTFKSVSSDSAVMDLGICRKDIVRQDYTKMCVCCCCSVTKSRLTLCDPMDCSPAGFPSLTISRSLLRFISIDSVMLSKHLILSHPFSSSQNQGLFQWVNTSGGQSIGASASELFLPGNIPLVLTNSRSDLNVRSAVSTIHKVTTKQEAVKQHPQDPGLNDIMLYKRWHNSSRYNGHLNSPIPVHFS